MILNIPLPPSMIELIIILKIYLLRVQVKLHYFWKKKFNVYFFTLFIFFMTFCDMHQ